MKATVENLRGSVEKLFPKESVEGADTVLRGSVRAPEALSLGDRYSTLPQGFSTVAQTTKILRFTDE